ncbi:MAG: hypothetical protein KDA24_29440 [Deltaproteobacteria bacterium]|nr:hypothetical protein [Deltaproteobacteria bacterium]
MRRVALFLFVFALAGCQYGPLEREENEPTLGEAFLDRDLIVSGTSIVRYHELQGNSVADTICVVEQEVVGYEAPEINDSTCVGCARVYRLGMLRVPEPECDFGAAAADIAFADPEFLPQSGGSNFYQEWVTEGAPREFGYSKWTPPGGNLEDWTTRLGLWRDESPDDPFSNGSWDCGAELCIEQYTWFSANNVVAKWWLALDIDD